jgi:endonuclease/exonuclease/phosphatase family metal-dependent hydrolase
MVTWNVQGRAGDWRSRGRALAEELAAVDPDVVALQESWVERTGPTQAEELAAEVGLRAAVALEAAGAGFDRYPQAPYWVVNSLLARWPLDGATVVELPDEHGSRTWRHALLAWVRRPDADGGPFLVASAHLEHGLERSPTRRAQAQVLASRIAACLGDEHRRREANPAVLGADLNAVPWSDEVRGLTGATGPHVPGLVFVDAWEAAGGDGRGATWSRGNPRVPRRAAHPDRRLDYVMVSWPRRRGVGHVRGCRLAGTAPVRDVWPSDHHAVVADLDL